MVAYNFQKQFVAEIQAGKKHQTIRAYRKNNRHAHVGERLQLYSGQRTKNCQKLFDKDPVCRAVDDVEIHITDGGKKNGNMKAVSGKYRVKRQRGQVPGNRVQAGLARLDQMSKAEQCANGRNLRDYEPAPTPVWNIATVPFTGEHFATFPPELAERCILAGCPKNGVVLDPFAGSGTTGLVALRHGRKAVLIEINPKFMAMSERRIKAEWHVPDHSPRPDFGPLFKNIPEAAE